MIGVPMFFVRTNGCNLRCRWCDSTYTFSGGKEADVKTLLDLVSQSQERWICLTGGEPLIQRDAPMFVHGVIDLGKSLLLETSGSLSILPYTFSKRVVIDMDIKTPSSGEERRFFTNNLGYLRDTDYVKFVVTDDIDFEFARKFITEHNLPCEKILQPAWGTDMKWLVEKALDLKMDVRVLPQLHKLLWGEKRGV